MNLSALSAAFHESLARREILGASLTVCNAGKILLELGGGFCDSARSRPWTPATPVLVWSATKGPAAACLLHSLQQAGLDLDTTVASLWPEFAAEGKALITIGQLLSHQAGLPALDNPGSIFDYPAVIDSLARQRPCWPPGAGHGYHPRTFGFLLDELVRRITGGIPLGAYWRRTFADPLRLDFWIGMPLDRLDQPATVYSPRSVPTLANPAFYSAFSDPASLIHRAFSSPGGLSAVSAMNTPEVRAVPFPAFGGIGTATALARFYSIAANGGSLDGIPFFTPRTLSWMTHPLVSGPDQILLLPTSFSAGFMMDPLDSHGNKHRQLFGPSPRAFGQPGAGGSIGFADPENSLSFAYVMNQMTQGLLPSPETLRLINFLYED